MTDDRDLLEVDVATCFVLTESGRIARVNSPERSPGPRLYMAGSASGNVLRLRSDVGDLTARAIEELAAAEPAFHGPDATPVHLSDYQRLLAAEAPVERVEPGLIWNFPARLDFEHPAPLVASGTPEGERLLTRLNDEGMPPALVEMGFADAGEFWPPWCVALDGGEVASIAFAARLGPLAAETGVATVSAFRGRGFAAAATAGWASLPALRGRTLFYSHSRANVSSRRVTERLGLRFIGSSLSIA
ncbi:MAG: GNAT family N-acetyltransferase [Chloroflexi bacterium]|nr:GNAT family N-acetyltransferase [Chloroflexota bacterium]